ncbi:MAG: phosphotransferase [Quadrisphaera sp.]
MTTPSSEALLGVAARAAGVPAGAVDVLTHREGRLVGRAHLPGGRCAAVKVAAEASAFASEVRAVDTLAAAGLPVSRVHRHEEGPPSVVVLEWAPGRSLHAGDPRAVRAEVLTLLGRVHALPAAAPYGGTTADLVSWIDGWTRHALGWWTAQEGVAADAVARAEAWWLCVRPMVDGRAGSTVLLDGRPEHFVVDDDGAVRMIDLADLQPGDPVMDLAVLELGAPGVVEDLLDGYRQAEVGAEHLRELLPYYVFLRGLAAAEFHADVLGDRHAAAALAAESGRLVDPRGRASSQLATDDVG